MNSVVEQDVYDVEQSTADLGETVKSQEWVWTVGKTRDREGDSEIQQNYPQPHIKCLVRITSSICGLTSLLQGPLPE